MKDLLTLALVIALGFVSYDYFRVREQLTDAKLRIEKLEGMLSRPHGASPDRPLDGAPPPHPGWLQQRIDQPNPLNQPPTQSGGGRGGGGPGGGGPGGGGPGGGGPGGGGPGGGGPGGGPGGGGRGGPPR